MTATNHAATGALVAVLINQPFLAIPLAFCLHFVMDAIPHFDLGIQNVHERNSSKLFRTILLIDALLAALLLFVLPTVLSPVYSWWLVFLCMFACMSPDLVWGWRFYFELKTKRQSVMSWFSRFHSKIQWSEAPKGIIIEVIWLVAVLSSIMHLK